MTEQEVTREIARLTESMGTDAEKWAKAFCKQYPTALCQIEGAEGAVQGIDFETTMRVWFQDALTAGQEEGYWNGREDGYSDGYDEGSEQNDD